MKTLREILPRASQSCIDANPQLSDAVNVVPRRGKTNKTEAEFALILEAMKQRGEILRYVFEGITLRFAGVKYTPDFVVIGWTGDGSQKYNGFGYTGIKLIEVKGGWIKGNRERAVERFRHAKTFWPEFTFELHQRTKDGWRQLI